MVEGRSLTTREAVEGVLASEHGDVLRESVAVTVREMMELEVAEPPSVERPILEGAPDTISTSALRAIGSDRASS